MIRRLLVAVDRSESAQRAAAFAAELAERLDPPVELVTLLHVLPQEPAVEDAAHKGRIADEIFADVRSAFVGRRIAAREEIDWGDPATIICEEIESGEYDLVVIGTRGQNPARRFILGSVSDAVIRNGGCPVTVVR